MIKARFFNAFVLFMFFTIASGCSSGSIPENISPQVRAFFGESILPIIRFPDSVFLYTVKPQKTSDKGENIIGGYRISGPGRALSSEQSFFLQSILLDENTYDFVYAKKGFLFPEYVFRLEKSGSSLWVFVDYYRNELMFLHNERELKEDFDGSLDRMKKLTDELTAK